MRVEKTNLVQGMVFKKYNPRKEQCFYFKYINKMFGTVKQQNLTAQNACGTKLDCLVILDYKTTTAQVIDFNFQIKDLFEIRLFCIEYALGKCYY